MGGLPSLPQPTLSFPQEWKKPRRATGNSGVSSGFRQRASGTARQHPLFAVLHFLRHCRCPLRPLWHPPASCSRPTILFPLQTQGKLSGPASFPSFFPPSFPLPPHQPRGRMTKEPQGMALPLMKNEYVKVELGMGKKRTDNKRDCQVQGGDRV